MKKYLRTAGSLGLLAVLAWKVDLAQVARSLAGVGWGCWAAALGVYLAAQVGTLH